MDACESNFDYLNSKIGLILFLVFKLPLNLSFGGDFCP